MCTWEQSVNRKGLFFRVRCLNKGGSDNNWVNIIKVVRKFGIPLDKLKKCPYCGSTIRFLMVRKTTEKK